MAVKELAAKASRAMFSLRSKLYSRDLSPKIAMDLFRKMILPIALYGSEIWGTSTIGGSHLRNLNSFFAKMSKIPIENVCLQMARFSLGVNKRCHSNDMKLKN